LIGFVSMRIEKDGDAFRQMMSCKNVGDVSAIHLRWVEETLRDYSDEMGRLMTICTNSTSVGPGQ
jgi:hypothetical protein